ncbi:MAG TPA: hypothetical protein VJ577_00895 [Burkholderiaceae bacterium]|nr:hypothetical protein [Burkholderiaceae bacterium]
MTPGNVHGCAQAAELVQTLQEATNGTVGVAFVDQSDTGELA